MAVAIKAENISKQYRLGVIGTGTLSHDLNRWWAKIRGKDDPTLKIGQANTLNTKNNADDYVWALKDINFEIQQGEAVGIIGKNGAGKSTLLKILSKVTGPTAGSIKVKGRIASLLEVGTGFHPELTGRENIFLNGAILGMTKAEIRKKFDEIVDFSGVEKYIDTPVKRYSSGMYVRLAFAVAAHLEPEILVVDEVLAVGDAEFQKKCLGKMKDVSANEGRTVLFVSHNMAAIQNLCNTGIYLEFGKATFYSNINDAISNYIFKNTESNSINLESFQRSGLANLEFKYTFIEITNEKNELEIYENDTLIIKLKFTYYKQLFNVAFGIAINDSLGNNLIECRSFKDLPSSDFPNQNGKGEIKIIINQNLKAGAYSVNIGAISSIGAIDYIPSAITLFIKTKGHDIPDPWYKSNVGIFHVKHHWDVNFIA